MFNYSIVLKNILLLYACVALRRARLLNKLKKKYCLMINFRYKRRGERMDVCFIEKDKMKKIRIPSCHVSHGMKCFILLLSKTCCVSGVWWGARGGARAHSPLVLLYKVVSLQRVGVEHAACGMTRARASDITGPAHRSAPPPSRI